MEGHTLSRARMREGKCRCMQALPVEIFAVICLKACAASAVHGVTEQRMPERCHMHADLVRASRFQSALHQRKAAEALQHLVVAQNASGYRQL